MRFLADKSKTGRQGTPQPANASQRLLDARVAADREFPVPRNADFDMVALF